MIDELIDKIKIMDNPTVIGLDPRYEMLPKCIVEKYEKNIIGASKAILEFNKILIDAVYDIIPAVKLQIAFYEMLGISGMQIFKETCEYVKEKNLIVIVDNKRGDIGSTAEAYSNAYLGKTIIENRAEIIYNADFMTVNPYMGVDSIEPFIKDCKKYNKGIFILLKTSNTSSADLQDLELKNGKKIYMHVGELIEKWGEELIGKYEYSNVAAVVGATHPEELKEIRKEYLHTFFLIPGYGVQGGSAQDISAGFDKNGIGGIVNASRSLIYAYKSDMWKNKYLEKDFAKATRAEAIRMKNELNKYINKQLYCNK